jgi:hypothetical protein
MVLSREKSHIFHQNASNTEGSFDAKCLRVCRIRYFFLRKTKM